MRHRGSRLLTHIAVALLMAAPVAARADQPAPPPLLVAEVKGPGDFPLGKITLPRAGGTAAARLCFVSNDGGRLDAEVTATRERRTIRLVAGNGSRLEVVQLPEFAATGQGIPTVLTADDTRLLVNDPGPGGSDLRRGRPAVSEAVALWVSAHAPGIAPLVAEAREIVGALAARPLPSLLIPRGYAFSAAPLLGLEILAGLPSGVLTGQELTVSVHPSKFSEELLARRPAWRDFTREGAPFRRVRARVVGGKDERLGEVSGTRENDGVTAVAVLGWDEGPRSETLRMKSDAAGVVRVTLERSTAKGSSQLVALETVPGGSGELWLQPWIVESAKGRRQGLEIPPSPKAETERFQQAFFDDAASALRAAGLSDVDGARLLWRWYRILDSETGRAFLSELADLADLLATMHAPPFGSGRESAWAGAVTVE